MTAALLPARASRFVMAVQRGRKLGAACTGLDGTFSIVVHEGLSYVASATYWDEAQRRQLRGSVGPFLVTGDTDPLKIVLSEETYRERR